MNITLTVTLADEVLALVRTFFNNTSPAAPAAPAAASKAEKEKKSTGAAKAIVAEVAAPAAIEEAGTSEAPAIAETVTIEEVRAAVSAKAQAGKRTEVKGILSEFGADKVTALSSAQYAAFLAKINAL